MPAMIPGSGSADAVVSGGGGHLLYYWPTTGVLVAITGVVVFGRPDHQLTSSSPWE